jgi:hypothetical protein
MKSCSNIKCKQSNPQPLSSFFKDSNKKGGFRYNCKSCCNDIQNRYYESNREYITIRRKTYCKEHADYRASQQRKYYERNSDKEKLRNRIWLKANPAKKAYYNAKRKASKLNATPRWLTEDQLKDIELFYIDAKWAESILGEPVDVDHIVPLQGENVCGLHVSWNLQLMSKSENSRKCNKF